MSEPLRDVLAQVEQCERELASAATEIALREVDARYGGRDGAIKRAVSESIAQAAKADKKSVGQLGNTALKRIDAAFEARLAALAAGERVRDLARSVDVTLPGRAPRAGHLHPIT